MADHKRKRTPTCESPNKRSKYAHSSSEQESEQSEWEAENILKEKGKGRKIRYLIKWKGSDPETGLPWPDSWEPKANCNQLLLSAWEEKKAAKEAARPGSTPSRAGKRRQTPKSSRRKQPHAFESTSTSTPTSSVAPSDSSAVSETPLSILEAEPATTGPSPKIRVGRRGSSLDREAHDYYSQLPSSQANIVQPSSSGSDLDSSQLFAAVPTQESIGIVPDSQSTAGEGTFIPLTQNTIGTTQQTLDTNNSQDETVEDSGLLEIVETAASRPPSPAKSIPETVFGPSAESQSQRRATVVEDPIEISDTSEIVSSSSQLPQEDSQLPAHEIVSKNDSLAIGQIVSGEQVKTTAQESGVSSVTDIATSQLAQPSPLRDSQDFQTSTTPEEEVVEGQLDNIATQGAEAAVEGPSGVPAEQAAETIPQTQTQAQDEIVHQPAEADECSESPTEQQLQDPPVDCVGAASLVPRQDQGEATAAEHPIIDPPTSPSPHRQATPPLSPNNDIAESDPALLVEQLENSPQVLDAPADTQPGQSLVTSSLEEPPANDTQPIRQDRLLQTLHPSEIVPESTTASEAFHAQSPSNSSNSAPQQSEGLDIVVASSCTNIHPQQETAQESVFDESTSTARSFEGPENSREQHAQIVSFQEHLSTQGELGQSPIPTTEQHSGSGHCTPNSRHDSSQESPEPSHRSKEQTSSPVAPPPTHSLLFDSHIPPRPFTPSSSSITMATPDTREEVARRVHEELEKYKAANPFVPRRLRPGYSQPTSPSGPQHDRVAPPSLHKRLLQGGASVPSGLAAVDGTRSPSSVPDRSPAPSAPTSLRTIALPHSNRAQIDENSGKDFAESGQLPPVTLTEHTLEAPHVPAIITTEPTRPDEQSSDDEMLSDTADDSDGFLSDDLQLAPAEYIIPLVAQGRQRDTYTRHIKTKGEVLDKFLLEPGTFGSLAEVENILHDLRAMETHIDLIFAEANREESSTQKEFTDQWGADNSVKFGFLRSLVEHLQDHNKHVIILIDQENDDLIKILETFCSARSIHWEVPSHSRKAHPNDVQHELSITILSSDTTPLIRPPDAIVCLDGIQDATKIRQKNWGLNPEVDVVPVLHLVIPNSVSHLERYISPTLDQRRRLHTIFAGLQHMLRHTGSRDNDDDDFMEPPIAGTLVGNWIAASPEHRPEWPLGSIGSVKDAIEYETQVSQATSPAPERPKRPHDDEDLDPAKRMRFTPQPHDAVSSTVRENEITHISDSMPGTAVDDLAALKARFVRLENLYQTDCEIWEAKKTEFQEKEAMWELQQTRHEDLSRDYRLLLGKEKLLQEKYDGAMKNTETLRERLQERTQQKNALENDLKQQRATDLLSIDEKHVEITNLRAALADANDEKARAQRNAESADKTAEYLKEQYRQAQDAAGSSQASVEELTTQNAKLAHQASGELTKLKAIHYSNQHENQANTVRALRAENNILKRSLALKEEELQRAKTNGGRMGVGTRATSATPQPKVRSRAASPSGFGRVSSLMRNG